VVRPASADDAKGLLLSSIFDPDPVIFLEHRWLHNLKGEVPSGDYRVSIGKARHLRQGNDLTVVSMSCMIIEAVHAIDHLESQGITCDLIDLRSVRPIDWDAINASVKRTGKLLVLDTGHLTGSVSGEIVARVVRDCWGSLTSAPRRLAMPDWPEATSHALTALYHVRAETIAKEICSLVERDGEVLTLARQRAHPHDVPGDWFTGPF
jgi:pyruvate/2-oxoglutarate/acetoin dehydrogenase E1 component